MRFRLLVIVFLFMFSGSLIPTRAGDNAPGMLSALTVGMNTPRATHSATLLLDGTVLIAGGMISDGQFLDSAELFDPATRKFSSVGQMTAKRTTHAAVLLKSGKV